MVGNLRRYLKKHHYYHPHFFGTSIAWPLSQLTLDKVENSLEMGSFTIPEGLAMY